MGPRTADSLLLPQSPGRVFALVLLVVFAMEGLIMLCLPRLPADWRSPVFDGLLDASTLTIATAPAVWFLALRPLRRLFELRGALLRRLFESQEQERVRVARDLHDGVGQHLTALLLGLRGIEGVESLASARERAGELRELAAAAHGEVRRLARGLRPIVLEEFGLDAAISRLCEDVERTHGVKVALHCEPPKGARLAPEIENALYRIAQEALSNVARHAGATRIEVRLVRSERAIALSIQDDGAGFDPDATRGFAAGAGGLGLGNMRERASLLGGDLVLRTRPGGGTALEVRVPVRT